MKKYISTIVFLIGVILLLSSCFQENEIGSELGPEEFTTEDVSYSSETVDVIDYTSEIKKSDFDVAKKALDKNGILGQLIPAQYSMRGGKEKKPPVSHAYQYQFSLEIDNYAGYFCLPQNFDGKMRSTYYDSQSYNDGAMGSFMHVKNAIVPVLNHPKIDKIPEIKALALLIYNYSSQEVADIYGAFPYLDYKKNKESNPFEYMAGEDIYNAIVKNIDTIVACFDNFNNRPQWYQNEINAILQNFDFISVNKNLSTWKKLANSLKLRMAIHIVKADPVKAKKWAEEAVASGVVESINDEFKLQPAQHGFSHPLIEISKTWNDTRLNASFESILASLSHPLLEFVFEKNSNDIFNEKDKSKFLPKNTKIVGLRSGIRMLAGQNYDINFRTAYSMLNTDAINSLQLYTMKLSEVLFLRAEGALRGWDMKGGAAEFYESGIREAFNEVKFIKKGTDPFEITYILQLDDYLNIEKAKPYTYQDPFNENWDIESLTKVGVKWNDADDQDTKLEKIITQKYIAGFPYSFEAWVDIRRTSYPKIFPVIYDDGDGSIPAGDVIRRIPFSDSDEASKADIQSTGIRALGGPDRQGTRIWWDKNAPNF